MRALTSMLGAMAMQAEARSFTHGPSVRALDNKIEVIDPLEHNAGGCGCGSGLSPSGGCCKVCGPGGAAMSGGQAAASRMLLNMFPNAAALLAAIQTGIGARGNDGMVSGAEVVKTLAGVELPCVPYQDAIRDCLCMVELPSQRVVSGGATATVSIQPQSGWFFAYYIDFNVNRPGTPPANPCVPPCEYQVERPRVRGCPGSPCIPPPSTGTAQTIPMSGNFLSAPQTCSGCGRPFIAVIPNLSNGTPLDVNFSGIAAGDVVQAVVRGFCFDTRICC